MRITAVDVAIVVLLGLSLFSFSMKYEPKYTFEYSGSQIIKIVRECDILDSTGFLYTVYVRGYWNSDVGHFEEEAFVCETGRGYLDIKLKDGRQVTVGGKMGYKEDIQANSVEIFLKSKSSVFYVLKPVKGSEEDVKTYIVTSSTFVNYPQEDMAVTCVLTMDADMKGSITLEAEMEDALRKEIFFLKKVDVELYEDGVTVSVDRLSMKEFDTLFEILGRYLSIQGIYTGDIEVVCQTAQEIDVEDVVPLESYTSDVIYQGSIHVRV